MEASAQKLLTVLDSRCQRLTSSVGDLFGHAITQRIFTLTMNMILVRAPEIMRVATDILNILEVHSGW